MTPINIVLFDLGNTLLYFDGQWPEVFARSDEQLCQALQASGLEIPQDHFVSEFRVRLNAYYVQREAEFIEHTTAYILRQLLAELGYPEVEDSIILPALEKMYAVSQSHWKIEADTHPTLHQLKDDGHHLGIISNAGDDADVHRLVDKAEIRPYFDFIVSSAAYGMRKPNPRIFEHALAHWKAAPEQAVMVGDTLGADILGAHHMGMPGIWITRRADTPANRAHADTIKPDHSIDTLIELPGLIKELNQ
ncbi:MAG: HAD family hydrolase [Chloroflexi bacterium]|nr:MAG: HAD family hydrolase [Chloroflexota bacterium]MBL1197095.1 HAD family hydrolase [Chloroflexota bacterium]NOH14390.1 HAD family hydrolase [Chloroflexota bacterium]